MIKKIIGIAVMAIVALATGWNISQSENEIKLSDLALDNVEALASGETGGSYYCRSAYVYVCSWIEPVLYGERISL